MSTTYSNRSIMVSHEHTRGLFVSLVSRQVSKLFFNLPSVCKIEYIVVPIIFYGLFK
jgi:hypothetical protein